MKEVETKDQKKVVPTQVRIPVGIHEYIQQESNRMGIPQNTFLIILLEQGRKLWDAKVTHLLELK